MQLQLTDWHTYMWVNEGKHFMLLTLNFFMPDNITKKEGKMMKQTGLCCVHWLKWWSAVSLPSTLLNFDDTWYNLYLQLKIQATVDLSEL
jgi:hypothetical protein